MPNGRDGNVCSITGSADRVTFHLLDAIPMFRNPLVVGAIVLAILAGIVLFGRGHDGSAAGSADAGIAAALDRIASKQDALAQRLDRIESLRPETGSRQQQRLAIPGASAGVKDPRGPLGPGGSLANQEANAAAQQQMMADRLVSDPMSPAWAASNEKVVADFLQPRNLARSQLPAPRSFQSKCHSHLCRISMVFADEAQANQTQAMLLMEIAQSLPAARTFTINKPDGSVELVMFAGDPAHVQ